MPLEFTLENDEYVIGDAILSANLRLVRQYHRQAYQMTINLPIILDAAILIFGTLWAIMAWPLVKRGEQNMEQPR